MSKLVGRPSEIMDLHGIMEFVKKKKEKEKDLLKFYFPNVINPLPKPTLKPTHTPKSLTIRTISHLLSMITIRTFISN